MAASVWWGIHRQKSQPTVWTNESTGITPAFITNVKAFRNTISTYSSFSLSLISEILPDKNKPKICWHWKLIKTLDLHPCCQKPRLEPEEFVLMFSHETHTVSSILAMKVNKPEAPDEFSWYFYLQPGTQPSSNLNGFKVWRDFLQRLCLLPDGKWWGDQTVCAGDDMICGC